LQDSSSFYICMEGDTKLFLFVLFSMSLSFFFSILFVHLLFSSPSLCLSISLSFEHLCTARTVETKGGKQEEFILLVSSPFLCKDGNHKEGFRRSVDSLQGREDRRMETTRERITNDKKTKPKHILTKREKWKREEKKEKKSRKSARESG